MTTSLTPYGKLELAQLREDYEKSNISNAPLYWRHHIDRIFVTLDAALQRAEAAEKELEVRAAWAVEFAKTSDALDEKVAELEAELLKVGEALKHYRLLCASRAADGVPENGCLACTALALPHTSRLLAGKEKK